MMGPDALSVVSVAARRVGVVVGHLGDRGPSPRSAAVSMQPTAVTAVLAPKHYTELTTDLIHQIRLAVADPVKQVYPDTIPTAQTAKMHIQKHGKDRSHHRPIHPGVVVYATTEQEVQAVVKICNDHRIPLTPGTTRTGLEGGSIPHYGGVALSLSRMKGILRLYEDEMLVTVEPGVTKGRLNAWLGKKGYFFPVDPGSNAGIGGYASTRASGTLSSKYGTMAENVVTLNVVLPSGELITTRRRTSKSSAGYNLTQLFVGSEGTLGVITQVTVKILRKPKYVLAAMARFDTTRQAAETVIAMKTSPGVTCLARAELMNRNQVEAINKYVKSNYPALPTLLLEFHGSTEAEVEQACVLAQDLAMGCGCVDFEHARDEARRDELWQNRRAAYYACFNSRKLGRGEGKVAMMITDVCVPIGHLADAIAATEKDFLETTVADRVKCLIVGHVGDGNYHCFIPYNPKDAQELCALEGIVDRMISRALAVGGTCTGEHGVGVGKRKAMIEEHGPVVVGAMKALKAALDPREIMNPGTLFLD